MLLSMFTDASIMVSLVLLTMSAVKGSTPSISTAKSSGTSKMNIKDRFRFPICRYSPAFSFSVCTRASYQASNASSVT